MIPQCRLCLLTLLCGFGLAVPPVTLAQETEIRWRSEYNAARKEAQDKGLPLFIDFYSVPCPWCVRLENDTLKTAAIAPLVNEKFIPLKVHNEAEPRLVSMLGISSFPTVVMASSDGKVLHTVVGFQDVAKFGDSLQKALTQVTPPDWMNKDLALAQKWVAAGDYPRAINALKLLLDDGKGTVKTQAQALMDDLEKKAAGNLEAARQLQAKGENTKAIEVITETLRTFPGLNASRDATEMLTRMAAAPALLAKERSRRAQELLTQARDFYKNKEYIPCLDRCEILLAGFGDLPEGQEGSLLANDIKNNPEWLQNAADTMGERLGGVYLALADSLLKRGQPDRAAFYLTRVITAFPGSRLAESAQIRLEQLSGASAIRPTKGMETSRP